MRGQGCLLIAGPRNESCMLDSLVQFSERKKRTFASLKTQPSKLFCAHAYNRCFHTTSTSPILFSLYKLTSNVLILHITSCSPLSNSSNACFLTYPTPSTFHPPHPASANTPDISIAKSGCKVQNWSNMLRDGSEAQSDISDGLAISMAVVYFSREVWRR